MAVEQSKKSCFTQTSPGGEESHLDEDSQLEYLTAYEECADDKNSSSEFSGQRETGKVEVKDIPLTQEKVPPQILPGQEGVSGESDRHTPSASRSQGGSCEKPAACTPGTGGLRSAAEAPDSQISTGRSPGLGGHGGDEHGGREGPRAASGCCRASGAQAELCSRAINTEITMMNKSRPAGWPRQTCADTASNTEWSFGAQGSHPQEQWESKIQLYACDWRLNTDRPAHLHKQSVKNCSPSCCQQTLQRATEAELQLLAVHHKMCHQHCLTVYELALEENTCFGRGDEKAELYSSLLLVLEELQNNYNNMRMAISMGTPLNALPPLSVEVKLPPISSFYVPYEFLRKCLCSDGLSGEERADFEASKLQEKESPVTMAESHTDGGQPRDSASPQAREEQCKDQDLKHGCMKTEEGTESWFDAKEDLTLSDFSVVSEETKTQQEKQGTGDLREAKTMERGSEHSIGVGGPSSSVLEESGENSLQKPPAAFSIHSSDIFESPYALNLSSFSKLIKRLQARHPEANRDKIVEALQQVRVNNKGMLCGLSISTIEERTSVILRKSVPSWGQGKH